jgi:outer membrane protein assembly factor BamD
MRSLASLLLVLATLLGGCSLMPDETDETAGWPASKLYGEAMEAMNDGAYDKAIKYFEKLEARYPYGRYAQQSQLEVAYAYYKQDEVASTTSACDRFIRLHPNHPNVDYAYYLKGLALFNEDLGILGSIGDQDPSERDPKMARESFDAFKELATRFPESKYSADAVKRLDYLVNALASHEAHVADFYLRRGAYVAAASRAQEAVKTYPSAPTNEQALAIMVRAYDALGLNDLRDDALRVMRLNFPNSPYLNGDVAKIKPWWRLW